jgi:glucose/arabinose dehydrogenase
VLGLLFEAEHGPSGFDGPGGGDEINLIEAGKHYGWPTIHHQEHADGMVSPIAEFTPAAAPSGAAFCSGKLFPGFRNNMFVATLVGKRLLRVKLDSTTARTVVGVEALLENRYGRLRDVVEGPDGALYLCTSNRDGRGSPVGADDRILKITPIF